MNTTKPAPATNSRRMKQMTGPIRIFNMFVGSVTAHTYTNRFITRIHGVLWSSL